MVPGRSLVLNTWVVPSAFSAIGWVRRRLTPVEVGRAVDLLPGMLPFFSTWAGMHDTNMSRMLSIPPMKVC